MSRNLVDDVGRPCEPPYVLACRMLNAIGWDGTDYRLRDPVALAIAPEVERINEQWVRAKRSEDMGI